MKKLTRNNAIAVIIAIFVCILLGNCSPDKKTFEHPYFGEEVRFEPKIFAQEIISGGLHEHSGFDISPDGKYAFWTISLNGHKIILQIEKKGKHWSNPEVASFSGHYRDEFHLFAPDGKTVYFNSYRPKNENDSIPKKFSHWMSKLVNGKWSEAQQNKQWEKGLWPYSMAENKTVYGWGNFDTTKKDADIYIQKLENGQYTAPIRLSDSINSPAIEYCPSIDPKERYIIFGRMGSEKKDGLYISFKRDDKSWCKAIRLPEEINAGHAERFPVVSPDGDYLFFNRQVFNYKANSENRLDYQALIGKYLHSPSNGLGDIYWVEMKEILKLKPKDL